MAGLGLCCAWAGIACCTLFTVWAVLTKGAAASVMLPSHATDGRGTVWHRGAERAHGD